MDKVEKIKEGVRKTFGVEGYYLTLLRKLYLEYKDKEVEDSFTIDNIIDLRKEDEK